MSADGDYSDTVPKGSVMHQEPAAGSPIKDSSILYVVISKGPRLIALPDIVGKSYIAAAEELTLSGFVVTQQVEYNADYSEGKVIEYIDHKAGDKVESDEEIVIKVSLGAEPVNTQN